MRRFGCIDLIVMCLFVAFLIAASCASVDSFPRRACLYDEGRRFNAGVVIEKRDDGAVLFKYDDRSEGDHGYKWVDPDDKSLGPCRSADVDRFAPEHP